MSVLPRPWSIRKEQFRQARRIHRGLLGFVLASVAVKLSALPIPSRRIRSRLFHDVYRRWYPPGLDAREAEHPLECYRSLYDVFTRGLKPECRPIPRDTPEVLSPCDGEVQDVGRVDGGTILTVKGLAYSLDSLLPGLEIEPYEGGQFLIAFLSPIDCHRVFSPQDGRLEEVVHVPGARLLVHPPFQRAEFPVYTLNERMIFRLTTDAGPCLVVMVAGWGVGHITLPKAPRFRPRSNRVEAYRWKNPPTVRRGDWMATFGLGSSVVLITSAAHQAKPLVSPQQEVRYGQPVLEYAAAFPPARS